MTWEELVLLQQNWDLPDLVSVAWWPEWHEQAACASSTADFFPQKGGDTRPAKAICAGCPVQAECLAFALDEGPSLLGIWGGTSVVERRRMRGARRAAA